MENETSFLNAEGREIHALNLYAGIGGNRKLWPEYVKVTSVEYNEEIASIYQDYYPNDTVIVGDANEYLLKNYNKFDFIWASPPCPSHSRVRMMASKHGDYEPILPDMTLWQEIIFLKEFAKCPFVIENVVPYYEPLIRPTIELDRHYFWANFKIQRWQFDKGDRKHNHVKPTDKLYGYDLSKYKIKHDKIKILRNMVNPEVGSHVFNCAVGAFKKDAHQTSLWNAEL
jgi:DNA (cytosine-5)-methyltransferase 1